MTGEGDSTSIGSILLHMGLITEDQLCDALVYQKGIPSKPALGMVLVERGYCSPAVLDMAIRAQEGLRSKNKVDKAVAVAMVAQARKLAQKEAVQTVTQKGRDLVHKMGYEHTPTPVFGIDLALLKR